MRISMIPNNDVQVIHASQGDTEREWEFELYDNEGLIDTSSIGQQTVYPVYAGGTEQLLPVNTATPSTSPMLADIQYPDQLRLEQYFTYRQCPTATDGKAKVKKLYGNSIVFNQLVQNGNFASVSAWNINGASVTYSVSGNVATISFNGELTGIYQSLNYIANHKYYETAEIKSSVEVQLGRDGSQLYSNVNNWQKLSNITSRTSDGVRGFVIYSKLGVTGTGTIQAKNVMRIDLTQLFGSGNEPTAQEFEALFSLPYYQYNQGTLLAFNGTDIKTTDTDNNEYLTPLPISDYFPTGMKSAGTVYDELSESSAVTRVGSVDLGSLTWYLSSGVFTSTESVGKTYSAGQSSNIICKSFIAKSVNYNAAYPDEDNVIWKHPNASLRVRANAYSTADAFKTAMSGVMLFYELAEPSEETFVSASFVSQNIETEMTADNGKLYAKSDGYTDNAGTFPCKIKIASDGVAYSSEFKLHVERKP